MPTDEQITRRLAGMMGWEVHYNDTEVSVRDPGKNSARWSPFDPLNDRNTAHECMLAMPEDKRGRFCFELLTVVCPNGLDGMNIYDINWLMITAAPRQLCMAMYAAMEGAA